MQRVRSPLGGDAAARSGGVTRGQPLAVGVLASGRGSNLQALLEACATPGFPARIALVISDKEQAQALERARAAGVEALWINPKDFADRESFDAALVREFQARDVGLVCHAGFMRILSPVYIRAFAGRALNIHPSLLPAFPGLRAQRQALDHGVKISGATVHFADEGLDSGPIVLQAAVPVEPGDTEATLAARILVEEHRLFPAAVRLFAEGRLEIVGRRVIIREPR
jgi:phosphoribosylglycinamide formyltransferase 1